MAYTLTKEKYLNDEEQAELLRILHKYKESDPRDCTLLFLALYTGARATEVLNIEIKDIDHTHESVYIRGIKNSWDRDIPLPSWLFKMVAAQSDGKESSEKLFNISYRRMNQIWENYKPCKKKLHALRHTFAINLYRKKKDLKLLQAVLGHKDWKNTMIYATYHYKFWEVREALLN